MDLKSNEPFWLVKNGILESYPSLKNDENCDVLVIGGGITGSLIAHQMVKDGYKTILIDKREVANGSTSATTSMLQYEIDVPLFELTEMIGKKGAVESYKACSKSIDDLEKISDEIKSTAGFERKKSLYFASKKKDISWLKKANLMNKNVSHLEIMRDCFYYTNLSRNEEGNKLTAEERLKRKDKWLSYMEGVRTKRNQAKLKQIKKKRNGKASKGK